MLSKELRNKILKTITSIKKTLLISIHFVFLSTYTQADYANECILSGRNII